jgi:uncharacterized membrane protein
LHSGFFPIHDNTQVQRVFEMTKSLKDGMFPVRWVEDLGFGYGYPIFNFYAPLAYYVGSFINILGLNALSATKLMMGLGIILSGLSMYLLAKEFWGKFGGIISALLYVFIPYHAVDIYVRGDVAEFWAYAFIPLVFYSLLKIHKTGKFRFIIVGGFSYAGLIISHNLTAFMATPFILVFMGLLFIGNKKSGKNMLIGLVLGLLLSAFYWAPALLEINYTNVLSQIGGGADYKDHFVCLNQLWSSPWGFGGSTDGCVDGLSFMIGKLHIILSVISVMLFGIGIYLKKLEPKKGFMIIYFIVGLLISVFLTLNFSKFIWDLLSPMAIFQYPWRFLIMVSFFISIICGSLLYCLQNLIKNKWVNIILLVTLAFIIVGFNSKYFIAQYYSEVTANSFTNDYFLRFTTSEISSEYMPKYFQKPFVYSQTGGFSHIYNETRRLQNSISLNFDITAQYETAITVPIAYFPAWQVTVDNKSVPLSPNARYWGAMIAFSVDKGKHDVSINFVETPIERASDLISIASILALIIGIILKKKLL